MVKNYIMIKKLLNNEKFVKKLEEIAQELKVMKDIKNETDISFIIPILILTLEQLRNSKTPFPKQFFSKVKNK